MLVGLWPGDYLPNYSYLARSTRDRGRYLRAEPCALSGSGP